MGSSALLLSLLAALPAAAAAAAAVPVGTPSLHPPAATAVPAGALPTETPGECQRVVVAAWVEDSLEQVHGSVRCVVGAGSSVPESVTTYPRLLRTAAPLDDIRFMWFYPDGFSAAQMRLWLQGRELLGDGAWQRLPNRHSTPLQFETTVPLRHGTFGRHAGVAYLLGGWFPNYGPCAAAIDYTLSVPANTEGFVGNTAFRTQERKVVAGHTQGCDVPALLVPLGRLGVARSSAGPVLWARPAFVAPSHPQRAAMGLALQPLHRPGHAPAVAEIIKTVQEGHAWAQTRGLGGTQLITVVTPLRAHLAESFAGGLAVSDRAFHLLQVETLLSLHRASLWREQFAGYADAAVRSAERGKNALPTPFMADVVATAWLQQMHPSAGTRPDAVNMLEPIAVIPEIDSLIFAPQIPFLDTYYRGLDETLPYRLRLDNFYHSASRGRVLYEKLSDRSSRRTAAAWVGAYLRGTTAFLTLLDRGELSADQAADPDALGTQAAVKDAAQPQQMAQVQAQPPCSSERLVEHLRAFCGAYPQVDYSFDAGGSDAQQLRLVLLQKGPAAAAICEPLTVEATGADGSRRRGARLGPGPLLLDLGKSGPATRVMLDPDGRLTELHSAPGRTAAYNNTEPPRLRLLLNNFSGIMALSSGKFSLGADFGLRRLHDLRHDLSLYAAAGPSALGFAVGLHRHFGAAVTPLRLSQSVSLAAAYTRLRPEYMAPLAGDEVSLGLSYLYDTRLRPLSANRGRGLTGQARFAMGRNSAGQAHRTVQLGLGALQLLPLTEQQALALRLRGDTTIGRAPPQDLPRLGGRYVGARGFEVEETRAPHRLLGSAEYRHVLEADAVTDLFGLLAFTRLDGALFADVVYLPVPAQGCSRQLFADVGYGLRFFADLFNIMPVSVQIDVGLPLRRCPLERASRLPVTIYLAFVQSFQSF